MERIRGRGARRGGERGVVVVGGRGAVVGGREDVVVVGWRLVVRMVGFEEGAEEGGGGIG